VEVFVTADRKMEYQQRLTGRTFGMIVLNAGGTQLETRHSVAEPRREAVARVQPGELIHVRHRNRRGRRRWGCGMAELLRKAEEGAAG
jgi:hypothetical protein